MTPEDKEVIDRGIEIVRPFKIDQDGDEVVFGFGGEGSGSYGWFLAGRGVCRTQGPWVSVDESELEEILSPWWIKWLASRLNDSRVALAMAVSDLWSVMIGD